MSRAHEANSQSLAVVGLDIGGANLKAAHSDGSASTLPFPLWKYPERLTAALTDLIARLAPTDVVAATMTGELCDCFASKEEGVSHILAALNAALPENRILLWRNDGRFVRLEEVGDELLSLAAANWLALTSFAARLAPSGEALVVDMGSTTTDIIPLLNGQPCPLGRTDLGRIRKNELVYVGASRTPLCALLGLPYAAELFATSKDVYLLLGMSPEGPLDCDTADGRPATVECARARVARMLCADPHQLSLQEIRQIAEEADQTLKLAVGSSIANVASRFAQPPRTVVISGAGEFLLRHIVADVLKPGPQVVSLAEELGAELSSCACAYAVAMLARDILLEV